MNALASISYKLWVNRVCGQAAPSERALNRRRLLGDAKQFIRLYRCADSQRAALNRRQLKAQAQGVQLWHVATICGEAFLSRKW